MVPLRLVAPRPTAVGSQSTTWKQFPSVLRYLLDEDPSELETEIYYLVTRS